MIQLMATLYIVTIGSNMLSGTDNFHFGFLTHIRYIYIFVLILYFFSTCHGIIPGKPFIAISILLVHCVLFGRVFVNKTVLTLTLKHHQEMIIYILMISLTAFFVWSQELFLDYMQWNFWTTAIILLRAGLTHTSHFVNPILFVHVFSSNHSYRSTFGFNHANFTGNMCLFTIAYSIFILEELKKRDSVKNMVDNRYVRMIIITDLLIGEILLSTQSRTSILAGIAFAFIFIFYNWHDLFGFSYRGRAIITYVGFMIIVLFLIGGGVTSVWSGAHRSDNITINYPIFKTFSPWTGMGYIPPYGFLTNAYGLGTYPLDIYYVYIFFTTGYIGITLIVIFLIANFIFILQIRVRQNRALALALFVTMLVTGLGQTAMIVYTLLPSMINWTIISIQISPRLLEGT